MKQQGRAQLCGGGRCLDAKAALPRKPEEAGRKRIEAIDRQAVRREATQAGPFAFHSFDFPVNHLLKAGDGLSNRYFLRRSVSGLGLKLLRTVA